MLLDVTVEGGRLRCDHYIERGEQIELSAPSMDRPRVPVTVLDCSPEGDAWIVRVAVADESEARDDLARLLSQWLFPLQSGRDPSQLVGNPIPVAA